MLPEGKGYQDKFVYGIFRNDDMIGCLAVVRGYPAGDIVFLGLLLVAEAHHGHGIGRAAYEQVEALCRSWPGIRRMRLAVVESNAQVIPFWEKMGFRRTEETRPYRHGPVQSMSIIFEKALSESI
jgi:GNAT superfamily N-acetyltransferase